MKTDMATANKVFADSNYLLALYNSSNALHSRAHEIARRLAEEHVELYLSDYIVLEILTLLSVKLGRPVATTVVNSIMQSQQLENVHITEDLYDMSWQIFQAIDNNNMDFVDCSSLAVMRYAGIKQLLTFDVTGFGPMRKQFAFRFFE